MSGLTELIDSLEVKFFKLNKKLVALESENQELKQKIVVFEKNQEQQSEELVALNSQIENLRMANSLLGSDENKRETKLKINALIREIDHCIGQLSE